MGAAGNAAGVKYFILSLHRSHLIGNNDLVDWNNDAGLGYKIYGSEFEREIIETLPRGCWLSEFCWGIWVSNYVISEPELNRNALAKAKQCYLFLIEF